MSDGTVYDADYYLRGMDSGKSLYDNYRWMPKLTIPMVARIISHCGIRPNDTILDFGCARGYTVRAFRELGYEAFGMDVSQWAVDNCDSEAKMYLYVGSELEHIQDKCYNPIHKPDWIVAKDVLEHVERVADTVNNFMTAAQVGVFAVVPLSIEDGGPYLVLDYEKDMTHVHRLTLATWVRMFARPGWSVTAAYRVPGVKDNYAQYERGNGFITARRI